MRIGISAWFLRRPDTGSGRYLIELLRALAAVDERNHYEIILPPGAGRLDLPADRFTQTEAGHPLLGVQEDVGKLAWEQRTLRRECRRRRLDLLHVPYFAPVWRCPVPQVVTIHDVIPLLLPEYRGSAKVRAYNTLVSAAARTADAILADSERSRQDILDTLGIPGERVHAVPLAAGREFKPVDDAAALADVRARYGLPERFILYAGGYDPRKNVRTLLRAFVRVRELTGTPVKLALVGADLPRLGEVAGREGAPLVEVACLGRVPQEDMPLLYNAAALFVYPSLYEGFGLPPLEAMACGTPVVCADSSSLPEVVGTAALLVPPEDAEGLALALREGLENEETRRRLRADGLRQAARFTWERTARETLAVYETVGKERR